MKIISGPGLTVRAPSLTQEIDFQLSAEYLTQPIFPAGGGYSRPIDDGVIQRVFSSELIGTNVQVSSHEIFNPYGLIPTFTGSNDAVGITDAAGFVNYRADGLVMVAGRTHLLNRGIRLNLTSNGAPFVDRWAGNVPGSLAAGSESLLPLLSGELELFSVYDSPTSITLNPNRWGNGVVDYTGISAGVIRDGAFFQGPVSLVSDRVILFANHWGPSPGDQVVFVSADNQLFTYTVATYLPNIGTGDVGVGMLNAVVDPSIKRYKLLPKDYAKYMVKGQLYTAARKFVGPSPRLRLATAIFAGMRVIFGQPPAEYSAYALPVENHDSGSEHVVVLTDGQHILISAHYSELDGPGYAAVSQAIQDSITTVFGLPDVLTYADLSAFPVYS